MTVFRVDVFDIHCQERPAWTPVLERIQTEEGLSRVGEAGVAWEDGLRAAAAKINALAAA
ncbi:mandelate racemase/muconate lactonizing enzyme family protein, partial [Pseudoalteromonas sp. S979]